MEVTLRDKIVSEGMVAGDFGQSLSDNPYDVYAQHEQHLLWNEGWWIDFNGREDEQ